MTESGCLTRAITDRAARLVEPTAAGDGRLHLRLGTRRAAELVEQMEAILAARCARRT
ncbi:hypothetical protein [Nitrobacter vulgaris]|uniref:hypothetical protein n=1 Tax=Nitrobacter vulgaris TaxID=29421 RepID=UPI001301C98D|nr:hypothetical protein [Nitrobacter vulgaris]